MLNSRNKYREFFFGFQRISNVQVEDPEDYQVEVECYHCQGRFRWDSRGDTKKVICGVCGVESGVVGLSLGTIVGNCFLGTFLLLLASIITFSTYQWAVDNGGGTYIIYFGGFIVGTIYLIKGLMLCLVRCGEQVSKIIQPENQI